MTQIPRIAVEIPLAASVGAVLSTIFIHALTVIATVNFVRREKRLGRVGTGFWRDFSIVTLAMSFALAAHLMEIAVWAVLFVMCGEFSDLGTAYYHSAVNFTTLGYGDLVMTPSWRLLGPLEAANGMLLFGVSTAMIFAVIQRLVEARFADLRE
jgi:hypothetical protein